MVVDIHTIRNQHLTILESFNNVGANAPSPAEIQANHDAKTLDQNIAVDALDGDGGFNVRADHVAAHLSKQAQLSRDKAHTDNVFDRLLLILNDISDTIRREFIAIQNAINDLYTLSHKVIGAIEKGASFVDHILDSHKEIEEFILAENFEINTQGKFKNKAARKMMGNYIDRTGNMQGKTKDLISSQLFEQMSYEQTVVIPQIQAKMNDLGVINDHIILEAKSLEEQMKILDDEYQSILDQPDSPEKIQALEDVQERIERLALESENAIGGYEHDMNTITNLGDTEFLYTETNSTPENEFNALPSGRAINSLASPTRQSFSPKPL